jgi:hypothetical protein
MKTNTFYKNSANSAKLTNKKKIIKIKNNNDENKKIHF